MSNEPMPNRAGGGGNPTSLSVEEMARLLSAGGQKKVSPQEIHTDIAAGAPVNSDGRMNLVHYAAWLAQ
jgi:hypothetical protein